MKDIKESDEMAKSASLVQMFQGLHYLLEPLSEYIGKYYQRLYIIISADKCNR